MTTITFDTLAHAKRLRDAGISEPQAEAQAAARADVLKGGSAELVTKQDLDAAVTDLRQEIALLKRDMQAMELRLTIKLGAMLVVAIGAVATLVKLL